MKQLFLMTISFYLAGTIRAQNVTIKADSVKLTNCDSTELIIENHTQNVPGFLYNKGNGRTIFKRGVQKSGDSLYIIGPDTLRFKPNAWIQGGNSFGKTSILGTLDNNHLDLYTNNTRGARLTNTGNLLLGSITDAGYKMQVTTDSGAIFMNPNLSVAGDRIRIGGAINTGDGQEIIFSASANGGAFNNMLLFRSGLIGLGYGAPVSWYVGNPTFHLTTGYIDLVPVHYYFGNTSDSSNASSLVTYASNLTEWHQGAGAYPSGQNYYYFGTRLSNPASGNTRAPLRIGADRLIFRTGPLADSTAGIFSEAGNLLAGPATDNGSGQVQIKGNVTTTGSVGIGTSAPAAQFHTTGSVRFAGLTGDSVQNRLLVSDANGNLFYRDAATLAANEAPPSSLVVNGPLTAQRLTLSTHNWPDYVFDDTYRLQTLLQLEKYVRQNKHLPGIPPAEEMEKKGMDVGAGQRLLLRKIEELTLYDITQEEEMGRQNKEIDRQTEELERVKERLEVMEKLIATKQGK